MSTKKIILQARGQASNPYEWIEQQLRVLLGSDVREVLDFLFTLEENELKEYLVELFGEQQRGKALRVATEIKKCRDVEERDRVARLEATHPERIQGPSESDGVRVYRKEDTNFVDEMPKKAPKKKKSKKEKGNADRQSQRKFCTCLATEHPLIGNCRNCGKVICELEGEGPCLFCNSMSEMENFDESFEKAYLQKEKLVGFDRVNGKRTVIFDDEADFFESGNKWLSPEDRKKLAEEEEKKKKEEEEAKRRIRVTIDLAGRKIVSSETSVASEEKKPQIISSGSKQLKLVNPFLESPAPKYVPQKPNPLPTTSLVGHESHGIIQHNQQEDISYMLL